VWLRQGGGGVPLGLGENTVDKSSREVINRSANPPRIDNISSHPQNH
jgi:hypothetical protein